MSSQLILLAEDNPVNREVALEMLELLGDQVDAVENGRETVAASAGVSYDLILMDCQMPKMDGFAVAAAIRKWEAVQKESRRVPIIALTALAQMSDRARCLAAGMDDYMSKPFTQQQLGDKIQRRVQYANGERETASDRSEAAGAEPV